MEKVNSIIKIMEDYMMENGYTIKCMEKESFFTLLVNQPMTGNIYILYYIYLLKLKLYNI